MATATILVAVLDFEKGVFGRWLLADHQTVTDAVFSARILGTVDDWWGIGVA